MIANKILETMDDRAVTGHKKTPECANLLQDGIYPSTELFCIFYWIV
jgi:hypothetical protein